MTTIGVYDSGIGGLTTAKIILNKFAGNDLYYLADNLNHPFGNTDEDKLKETVANGIKRVRAHSDIVVLACNTASSVTSDEDVIKLLPPVEQHLDDAENTLLMATNRTLSKITERINAQANALADKFSKLHIACTAELATLVEIQANLQSRKNNLNMDELLSYFEKQISDFKGVKKVILGCSHYLYCKSQISEVLGEVEYFDGNESLCGELEKYVESRPDHCAKITFDFTSQSERTVYEKILKALMNE